jgi:NDP-sugar pyrophosphorylase family protein
LYAISIVGGKGERLRPLTDDRPKCMVLVGGKPLLEYHVGWLAANGVTHLVLASGYMHDTIEDYFGNGERFGVAITYSVETKPLGRGGAFKLAYAQVPDAEPFVIGTNGDNIHTQPLAPMIEQHTRTGAVATLLLTQLRSQYGLVRQDGERITGFEEKPLLPHWLSAGAYVLNREFFADCPDVGDHEDELFPRLAAEGKLYGFQSTTYWKSIDTVKDVNEAAAHMQAGS